METIAMMTSIILVVVLTIDIALTIHKLIAMHKLLKLIENGEISYIQAVHNIMQVHGINTTTLRRGKAVPWSERNRESQSRESRD